jgi:hypothetical protein
MNHDIFDAPEDDSKVGDVDDNTLFGLAFDDVDA